MRTLIQPPPSSRCDKCGGEWAIWRTPGRPSQTITFRAQQSANGEGSRTNDGNDVCVAWGLEQTGVEPQSRDETNMVANRSE